MIKTMLMAGVMAASMTTAAAAGTYVQGAVGAANDSFNTNPDISVAVGTTTPVPHLRAEVEVAGDFNGPKDVNHVSVVTIGPNLAYDLPTVWNLHPYVFAGGGELLAYGADIRPGRLYNLYYDVGAGVNVKLNSYFDAGVRFKHVGANEHVSYVGNNNYNNNVYEVTLTHRF